MLTSNAVLEAVAFVPDGAHDFRWVSGAYFVLRILMLISYIILLK